MIIWENMKESSLPTWLEWARKIQSIAQIGQTYAENEWQRERYLNLMEIAAEIVTEHTDLPFEPVLANFQAQPGYATPKIDVRGAVFRDEKMLMVQEKIEGGWTMPGGGADVGDLPAKGAEREVWEESGFHVIARKLIGIYDANRVQPMEFFHAYKLVFLCDILDGEARTSNETTAVAFFAEDEIPHNLAGERTKPRHIRDAFTAWREPGIPTVFD
jgi:ADP-ribose pyrophosphatase YjhB (NUDIX family)